MPTVGFSEAARLVNLSRQSLYKMARSGQISSVQELIPGRPGKASKDYRKSIDVAELQRVFGKLSIVDDQENGITTEGNVQQLKAELNSMGQLLQIKEKQLQEATEREEWLKKQIDQMSITVKLIGYSKPSHEVVSKQEYDNMLSLGKQNYRESSRELKDLQKRNQELVQQLKEKQNRGFFTRLFNRTKS